MKEKKCKIENKIIIETVAMLVTTLKSKSAGCHSNQRNEGDFGIINLKISYCEPPKRGRRSERRGERRAYKSREDLYSDKIEIGRSKSCLLFKK